MIRNLFTITNFKIPRVSGYKSHISPRITIQHLYLGKLIEYSIKHRKIIYIIK